MVQKDTVASLLTDFRFFGLESSFLVGGVSRPRRFRGRGLETALTIFTPVILLDPSRKGTFSAGQAHWREARSPSTLMFHCKTSRTPRLFGGGLATVSNKKRVGIWVSAQEEGV